MRARTSDPVTSHEAGESVSTKTLTTTKAAILELYQMQGAMTDEILTARVRALPDVNQSSSSIRSRRNELVQDGSVHWTGRYGTTASGKRALVWDLADFEY